VRTRSIAALLGLGLVVSLAACGSSKSSSSSTSTSAGSSTSAASTLPDLGGKTVTVAVENAYVPFNYINKDTKVAEGWDYDTWREICKRLNCVVSFKQAAWEGMIQAVADGQYDAAADGITITADRAKVVDFSTGYIKVAQRLLVKKGETRFASLADFKSGKFVVGTQTGTTNYDTAVAEYGKGRVKAFEQFPFAVQALINGDVDAVIMDDTAGEGYAGADPGKVQLLTGEIKSDELGFIFKKGSDLVDSVNKALAAMTADGSLTKLNSKYFNTSFVAPVASS
jgi:polar amino acid transport system substrate-binding protein